MISEIKWHMRSKNLGGGMTMFSVSSNQKEMLPIFRYQGGRKIYI